MTLWEFHACYRGFEKFHTPATAPKDEPPSIDEFEAMKAKFADF